MQQDFQNSYRSTQWQEKKNKILTRDNYTCKLCCKHGDENTLMHVHHLTYDHCQNGKAWDCPDDDLVTLCDNCHKKVHSGTPYKSAQENYKHYDKIGDFISRCQDSDCCILSTHLFSDGMAGCVSLENAGVKAILVFSEGEILSPSDDEKRYNSLPPADLTFEPKTTQSAVAVLDAICTNKDPYQAELLLIDNFERDIPWRNDTTVEVRRMVSSLIVYGFFGDERIQQSVQYAAKQNFKK